VLASIQGSFSSVESFDGTSLEYRPGRDAGLNSLHDMDHLHGYWVKMEETDMLSIVGVPAPEETGIPLEKDWNLVSYLPDAPLPIEIALSSIDGLYTAVLGYDGRGLSYYPSIPTDLNTLHSLSPGRGYWVRMAADATLVYPD